MVDFITSKLQWFRWTRRTDGVTAPSASTSTCRHSNLPVAALGGVGVGFIGFISVLAIAGATTPAAARDWGPTLPIGHVTAENMPSDGDLLMSDLAVVYPVDNPGWSRGRLRPSSALARSDTAWLTRPLAIVADDRRSRDWLRRQSRALQSLNASILVIRVHSIEKMRALRTFAPELPMAPAVVPEWFELLQRSRSAVYPLVVMPSGELLQDLTGHVRSGVRNE